MAPTLPSQRKDAITVICEGGIIHTNAHPFCADVTCPCHADSELLHEYITQPLLDGVLTEAEAKRIFLCQQLW